MDTEHVHIDKQTPDAYRAMVTVATAVTKSARVVGLSRSLTELVNVRVADQRLRLVSGGAQCSAPWRSEVTDKQLATLSVWRDTELFDDREQAALRLAEITTTLPDHDTAEREYARAREVLTDDELSSVIWVATAINAFNRVSILSRHPVRP